MTSHRIASACLHVHTPHAVPRVPCARTHRGADACAGERAPFPAPLCSGSFTDRKSRPLLEGSSLSGSQSRPQAAQPLRAVSRRRARTPPAALAAAYSCAWARLTGQRLVVLDGTAAACAAPQSSCHLRVAKVGKLFVLLLRQLHRARHRHRHRRQRGPDDAPPSVHSSSRRSRS